MPEPVPFLDLGPGNQRIKSVVLEELAAMIDASAFVNGPWVAAFEAAFARFCCCAEAVGVASGLDALRLALIAVGLEPGDEVLVPAATFAATFEAVAQAGGVPVPADITAGDRTLDMDAAAAACTPRTRVVLPVHLYGHMADMRRILALAGRDDLTVIEDACQAHGACRDGIRAGAGGVASAFSFYPGKNLGAFGDAGAVTTSDHDVAGRLRMLREHGQRERYEHALEGFTSRLDSAQAIVLLQKLATLDDGNRRRREAAARYRDRLTGIGDLTLPRTAAHSAPVWHLYVIETDRRDALATTLREHGIGSGLHYPVPPHLSPAYERLGHRAGAFPVAEALSRRCLSLPIGPDIPAAHVDRVCDVVTGFFDG